MQGSRYFLIAQTATCSVIVLDDSLLRSLRSQWRIKELLNTSFELLDDQLDQFQV